METEATPDQTPADQPPPARIRIPGPKTPIAGRGWRFSADMTKDTTAKAPNVFAMLAFRYRDRQAVTSIEAGPDNAIEWHVSARKYDGRNTPTRMNDAEFARVLADFDLSAACEIPFESDPTIRHAVIMVPSELVVPVT